MLDILQYVSAMSHGSVVYELLLLILLNLLGSLARTSPSPHFLIRQESVIA